MHRRFSELGVVYTAVEVSHFCGMIYVSKFTSLVLTWYWTCIYYAAASSIHVTVPRTPAIPFIFIITPRQAVQWSGPLCCELY